MIQECACPVCGLEACDNPHHLPPRFSGTNPVPGGDNGHHGARRLKLMASHTITPAQVTWLWDERLACGSFSLLGGREGIGKSLFALTLAADLSTGRLQGCFYGRPKGILIAATEDSWPHTLVPRLMAAGADLTRIFRVDVTVGDRDDELSLPDDIPALVQAIQRHDVALVILDPLLSRLDAAIDTHKDADVRTALEPIVSLAEQTGAVVLGLIHVNQSGSQDALTTLMGSRAFAAVARTVLFAMLDPTDEDQRLLGLAKNNLGRMDVDTLAFTIAGYNIKPDAADPWWTGQLIWRDPITRSIRDCLSQASATTSVKKVTSTEAADWLRAYLERQDGPADTKQLLLDAADHGFPRATIYRAKRALALDSHNSGFPCRAFWKLPDT